MSQILLLLEHRENRRLLSEWLSIHYEVIVPDVEGENFDWCYLVQAQTFDLCIIGAIALDQCWEWVQAKRKAEQPVILPFLLVTARLDVNYVTRHLWQSIDDLITKPIKKVELQARVEILLRSRQLSLELNATNLHLQEQITARQLAEAEREQAIVAQRQSEAQFKHLVQSNLIGMIAADIEGNITDANDAFLAMVGYTYQDLVQGKVRSHEITPPEYHKFDQQAIEQLKISGVCTPFEKEYLHRNGEQIPVIVGGIVIETFPHLIWVAFVLDNTKRKQAEAEVRNALQKERKLNELKSRFISMVSHEFRNPLNIIFGTAQLLERNNLKLSEEKKQDFLQRQKAAVKKLVELLDDVLTITRAETGNLVFNPSPLNLEQFCCNLVAEMQVTANESHTILFVPQNLCSTANVDKNLLQQILTNLLSNAIKYSPQGGTILVELACQEGMAIFRVKDRGIGIPLADQQQLFELFHRAGNVGTIAGTGLGLAIVKQAVNIHRGTITFESEVGDGTTFIITLPIE